MKRYLSGLSWRRLWAISRKEVIQLAVLDEDRTPRSRELVDAFSGTGWFKVTEHLSSTDEIAPLLDGAKVRMVLHVPRGFQADLASGVAAPLQALVDGADANTA